MTFKSYLNQNYEQIKAQCLNSDTLFVDKKFPADQSSVAKFKSGENIAAWKRPFEFVPNPEFIVQRIEPNDIDQGQLGDCWFISAAAVVASIPEYAEVIIPKNQSFNNEYAGIFKFRFWRFGEWIEVVVDDLLPVDDNDNLIYCHNNKDTNEMFAPLLEKAYAKLNSCYEFIDGGDCVDAMIDMTGGIHERFKIKKTPNKNHLWDVIFKAYTMKSLCGTSIDVGNNSHEEIMSNGLVLGHAYCILELCELIPNDYQYTKLITYFKKNDDHPNSVKLLKIRNPWGQSKSYTGRWSSGSKEWQKVSDEIKQQLNITDQTDGQFFISLDDFVVNFDELDLVHVNMNAFNGLNLENATLSQDVKWITQVYNGEWVKGVSAAGCGNENYEEFFNNPQYCISLKLLNSQDQLVSLIVSLMQTDQVKRRSMSDGSYERSNEPINVSIYSVKQSAESKFGTNKKFTMRDLTEVYSNESYITQREVTGRCDLKPGNYVIIPSTFDKDVAMKFVLRVFIEGQAENIVNVDSYALVKQANSKLTLEEKELMSETEDQKFQILYYTEEEEKEATSEQEDDQVYARRNYQRPNKNFVMDSNGQVVSRACMIM